MTRSPNEGPYVGRRPCLLAGVPCSYEQGFGTRPAFLENVAWVLMFNADVVHVSTSD